jgi:2-amino-4-hydroxy-6-hydroxymethyldihydropteridine diphosphokinase
MNRLVIAAGSNIRPQENLAKAKEAIEKKHRLLKTSQFRETKPFGNLDQPNFIDVAFLVETAVDQKEMKTWLRALEKELGRVRGINKYGPLTLDLDIVVWNKQVIDSKVYEHAFLKESILEVWPDLIY